MTYLPINDYDHLYKRYQERPISELLALAGIVDRPKPGTVVWDLCCGGGEITMECHRLGATKIVAVDACAGMTERLRKSHWNPQTVRLSICSIEDFLEYEATNDPDSPDIVFCRQGVNYWLNDHTALALMKRMKPGSVFVFNTFNKKPPYKPMVKEYEHEGFNCVEVSWSVLPDKVHHVQIRQGMPSHTTVFRWISPDEFVRLLNGWYSIQVHEVGGTSLYRCEKRDIGF